MTGTDDSFMIVEARWPNSRQNGQGADVLVDSRGSYSVNYLGLGSRRPDSVPTFAKVAHST